MLKKIIAFTFTCIFLISCTKQYNTQTIEETVTLISAADDSIFLDEPTRTWNYSEKKICILFGYGYNDFETAQNITHELNKKYGSAEDNGMILPLVYPDNFKRGTKVYITTLTDLISDVELQGMILLGAPDGTHVAIARLQDSWNGSLPYPIISLFSQDNVLGMEDSADFVLDKSQKAEINGIIAEEEESYVENVPEIIMNCVKVISYCDTSLEKNAKLYEIVKFIAGNQKVDRYSDPDTGLISINHFVIE